MKKRRFTVILIISMLFSPVMSEAEDTLQPKSYRHEAGMSLVNLSYYHGDYNFDGSTVFAGLMNGFFYKYHFKKNYALRLTTVLNLKEINIPSDNLKNGIVYYNSSVNYYYEGMLKSIDLRLGVERDFGKGKLKPFVAIDFQYLKSVEEGQEHLNAYPRYRLPRNFRHELESVGAGVFLGLKYDVNSRIRLSSEIGFIHQRYNISNQWISQNYSSDQWTYSPELSERKVGSFTNILPGRLFNIAFRF